MAGKGLSSFSGGLMMVLLGCSVPLPGNDFHDDTGVQDFYIAVPCELRDRIDASALPDGTDDREWNVVLACDPSAYPPEVGGRSIVLFYVDYTDSARLGLREQIITALEVGGDGTEFAIFERFCGDAIEFGGWQDWPGQGLDLQQLRLRC